jgi:hypothetical protein
MEEATVTAAEDHRVVGSTLVPPRSSETAPKEPLPPLHGSSDDATRTPLQRLLLPDAVVVPALTEIPAAIRGDTSPVAATEEATAEAHPTSAAAPFAPISTAPMSKLPPHTTGNDDKVAEVRERLKQLNLQELQELASECQVNVSEYMAQRNCLDDDLAEQFAAATAAAAAQKQSGALLLGTSHGNVAATVRGVAKCEPAPLCANIINHATNGPSNNDCRQAAAARK